MGKQVSLLPSCATEVKGVEEVPTSWIPVAGHAHVNMVALQTAARTGAGVLDHTKSGSIECQITLLEA